MSKRNKADNELPAKRVYTFSLPMDLQNSLSLVIASHSDLTELAKHLDQTIAHENEEAETSFNWFDPIEAWQFAVTSVETDVRTLPTDYRGKTWKKLLKGLPLECSKLIDAIDALPQLSSLCLLTATDRSRIRKQSGTSIRSLENAIARRYFARPASLQEHFLSDELWQYAFFCLLQQPKFDRLASQLQYRLDSGKCGTTYYWSRVVKALLRCKALTFPMRSNLLRLLATIDGRGNRTLHWNLESQLVVQANRPFRMLAPETRDQIEDFHPWEEVHIVLDNLSARDNPAWLYYPLYRIWGEKEVWAQRWKEKHHLLLGKEAEAVYLSDRHVELRIREANQAYQAHCSYPVPRVKTSWKSSWHQSIKIKSLQSLTVLLAIGLDCDTPILEAVCCPILFRLANDS